MTRRMTSRRSMAELAKLTVLARMKAHCMEHRLVTDLQRVHALKAEIETLGDRRGALIANQSQAVRAPDEFGTGDATLAGYLHIQADALRRRQAALYRELARAEAEVAPIRIEAARTRGRVAALEKLARSRDRRHP